MKCHFGHFNCNMIWDLETLGQTAYLLASFHRNGCTKASQILKVYRWVYHTDDTLNFCASHVARPWMPHVWSKANIFILTLLASCFNHKLSKARFLDSLDDKRDRSGDHGLFSTSEKSSHVPICWDLMIFMFFSRPSSTYHLSLEKKPAYISQLLRFHEKRQYLRQNTGKRWDRNGQNVEVICHGYLSEGLLKNGQKAFMAIHGDLTSHAETPRSESNPGRH